MESERLKLTPPSLIHSDEMFNVVQECMAELSEFLLWFSGALAK